MIYLGDNWVTIDLDIHSVPDFNLKHWHKMAQDGTRMHPTLIQHGFFAGTCDRRCGPANTREHGPVRSSHGLPASCSEHGSGSIKSWGQLKAWLEIHGHCAVAQIHILIQVICFIKICRFTLLSFGRKMPAVSASGGCLWFKIQSMQKRVVNECPPRSAGDDSVAEQHVKPPLAESPSSTELKRFWRGSNQRCWG